MADSGTLLQLLQWRLSLAQADGEPLDPREIRDWLWLSEQLDGVALPRTFAPFQAQPRPQSQQLTELDLMDSEGGESSSQVQDEDFTPNEVLPPDQQIAPDPLLPSPFPPDPPQPELKEEPTARLLAETTLPDAEDVKEALRSRHGALPVRVSEIGLLPFPLQLLQALRPLLQRRPHPRLSVLDEERSASKSAETRLAWPVFRPRLLAQVTVRVVLDGGVSMAVWEPLALELQRVLASSQAFRQVLVQRLEPSHLTAPERGGGVEEQTTVILLLSDSAGHHWWDGTINPWLESKTHSQPLVLIHTLPPRYWATTALSQAEQVTFSNRIALAPNSRYEVIRRLPNPWDPPEPADAEPEDSALRLPMITLDRRELSSWAALVAGEPRARCVGRVLTKTGPPAAPAAEEAAGDQELSQAEAESLWQVFESRASPEAQDLLMAMAASPVLTLPILRLLQAAEAPRAFSPQPLAEVLVSGLVRRLERQGDDVAPEHLQFELLPAVRRLLVPRLSPERHRQVLASVTDLLERHWNKQGTGTSFKALLLGPKDVLKEEHPDLFHIANVTAAMLDSLPGQQFRE
ncbi:MAG: SAV_2336 N-terminal domain-related protein, partial [Cyanobium sp.]